MPTKQHMTFYEDFSPKTYTEEIDGKQIVYETYHKDGTVIKRFEDLNGYWMIDMFNAMLGIGTRCGSSYSEGSGTIAYDICQ